MYQLNPLPFSYEELEPFLKTHAIALHYQKHQKNYLKKLNSLLITNNYDFQKPIENLYKTYNEFPTKVIPNLLFNLGGIINHDLFWHTINPHQKMPPNSLLLDSINHYYKNMENFKNQFNQEALNLKGSGYVFLVKTSPKEIKILSLPNQDSPLLYGYTPLLCIDMWEHAYYLNYQNNKQEYLDNFWDIVNFNYANQFFTTESFESRS